MRRARGQHPVGNAAPLNAHPHHAAQLANVQDDDLERDMDGDDDLTINGDGPDDDPAAAMIGAMGHASIRTPPALSTTNVGWAPGSAAGYWHNPSLASSSRPPTSLITQGLQSQSSMLSNDDADDSEDGGSTIVP